MPAAAAPGDGGQPADAPRLGLAEVGAEPTLAFYGSEGVTSLTLPVPSGLTPAALEAVVELPVNVATGTVTVTQEDRLLARVPLPPEERAPISIPLAGAEVVDNAIDVTLRSYVVPIEGYCLDPSNPLRLVGSAVRYEGVEAPPSAVADFLPPVLRQLDLFLPAQPSPAETDAALRLSTAVVARYGTQNTAVTVTPVPDGQEAPVGPSLPLHRQIVIREGADAGVQLLGTVGVPSLLISGPPGELTNQARLLSSDVGRLALTSKAVVGPLRTSPQLPADVTTLRQLGQPGVNATGLSPQVSIGLDQTRLGRAARDVRVHLRGSYTPLPPSVGGQLVAAIGGQVLDRWPADSSGTIDRWVDVPNDALQRYTNLGVSLNISGNTGRCGEFQPLTLVIDGDSPVQSSLADPPVPAGFQALPQALMPRVEVGMSDGFDDARRAIAIMVGLQRLSALPIDTVVRTLDEVVGSPNPALMISAGGWTDDRVTLPVADNSDGELTVQTVGGDGEPTTLTLDPALRSGSLQTTYQNGRTVLIATSNNAPEQLDALLGWLGADADRWSALTGAAVLAAPGQDPVSVTAGAQEQPAAVPEQTRPWWLWVAGAAAIVLAGAVLAVIVLRRRRTSAQS